MMALTPINLGSAANDGKGDNLRTAGGKINDNFARLTKREFETVAALLASSNLGYGSGAAQVAAGNIIRTRAEGFAYQVAASDVSDHHVTTAGGAKLYVLPNSDGSIQPEMFGAKSDGTDQRTPLGAFFSALGSVYHKGRMPGDYTLAGTLTVTVKDEVEIDATGAHFRPAKDFPSAAHLVRVSGLKGSQVTKNLTQDALRGVASVYVNNNTNLKEGMICQLSSQEYFHKPSAQNKRTRETNRIRFIDGTRIFLDAPSLCDFTNAGHVADGGSSGGMEFRAWDGAKGVVWRGGTFHGQNGNTMSNFVVEYLSDTLIENVEINECYRFGIYVRWTANVVLRNCRSWNHGVVGGINHYGSASNEYGYGFMHADNAFSIVENCVGGRGWHSYDAGDGQRDVTYVNCRGFSDTYSFSTHEGCILARYINCISEGKSGHTQRARFVEIIGGSINYSHLHGISWGWYTRHLHIKGVTVETSREEGLVTAGQHLYTGTTGNVSNIPQKWVIENCYFPRSQTGILVAALTEGSSLIFRNNLIEVDPDTPRWTRCELRASHIIIDGNTLINSYGAAFRVRPSTGAAEVTVSKNTFRNTTNLTDSHFLEVRHGTTNLEIIDNDVMIYGGRNFLRVEGTNNVTVKTLKGNVISGATSASNAWAFGGSTSALAIELSLNNAFKHMSGTPFNRAGLTVTTSHNDWFPGFRAT
jgi:hypothetical protein